MGGGGGFAWLILSHPRESWESQRNFLEYKERENFGVQQVQDQFNQLLPTAGDDVQRHRGNSRVGTQ